MISWILSKLFPFHEASYTVYRRETKKIPVHLHGPNPSGYLRSFEFRNTLLPGGSK